MQIKLNKNICEIYYPEFKKLSKICNEYKNMNIKIFLEINLDIYKNLKKIQRNKFGNPYIIINNNKYLLCLEKVNDNKNLIDNLIITINSYYKIINNENCYYNILLSSDCINKIKKIYNKKIKGKTQKELVGNFKIDKIKDNNIIININEINMGEDESTDIKEGIYTFHTHPKDAYISNNVELGWPSAQDFLGFLNSFINYSTILHLVISLEGIYLLLLGKDFDINFVNKNYKEIRRQIKQKFKYSNDYKNNKNPEWYINDVNKKQLLGKKIFKTKFINWENIEKPFKIYYDNNDLCKLN
tara:strand:- start:386 stop:1285 length:900 start_codon:yes stop_codon:yes gene_type:complete